MGVEFDFCCNPKRGDDIIGFKTFSNVVVHHKFCERAASFIKEEKEMIFVKWTRNAPHRYKIILTLENKRGALASFLTYLVKLGVDVVGIKLDENSYTSTDYFEIVIELNENLDSDDIKNRLKERHKIVEFISLNDAYN